MGLIQCNCEKTNIEMNKPMSINNYILNLLNIEDENIFILRIFLIKGIIKG